MPSPESLRQTVTWVLVPNGRAPDGQARISVFVTPALAADDTGGAPTLADFVDFVDWPARLREARFRVVVGDRHQPDSEWSTDAVADLSAASGDAWRTLLPPHTPVQPFAGNDLTAHPVMTYSEPVVAETLEQAYADTTALALDDVPVLGGWEGQGFVEPQPGVPFAELANVLRDPANAFLRPDTDATFDDRLTELLTVANDGIGARATLEEMVEVMPATGATHDELARALAFNRSVTAPARSHEPDPAEARALADSFDLHRILAALGDHPALLRRLGLVFDLTVPMTTIAATPGMHEGLVRLVPSWPSQMVAVDAEGRPLARNVDSTPTTEYVYLQRSALPFRPASYAEGNPPGLLYATADRFRVEQSDVDGTLEKAAAMVVAIEGEPTRTAPPAPRTAGVSLVAKGWAATAYRDIAASAGRLAGADPSVHLFAEHLTRGYRLDVFDEEAGRWFSLHATRTSYERDGRPFVDPVDGEGLFHVAATGAPTAPGAEPAPGTPLYLHEAFVRWDGWSLSAPRPGRPLSVHPNAADVPPGGDVLTSTGLRIQARARPGTLPRLRFGRTYRLRVRTVDLAGNGLDLATADGLTPELLDPEGYGTAWGRWETDPFTFLRFEPVPPPVVVLGAPLRDVPGEAHHRLVVRSAFDPDLASQLGTDPGRDERFLLAPKASVELAERHGAFDDAIGSTDPAAHRRSYGIAAQESGVMPDGPVDDIPYLPDPLSAGVAVAGIPGMPTGEMFYARWDAPTWDNPKPIRFRLVAHAELYDPGPQWDPTTRTVTVHLAPARRKTIRVSSMLPPPPARPPLGQLEWSRRRLDEDSYRRLEAAVLASRHCMFTPWQELELVHAVQRPRTAPDLQLPPDSTGFENRPAGATDYRFTGSTIVDHHSTAGIDLVATWHDWHDDPAAPMLPVDSGPPVWHKEMTVEIGSIPVAPPATDDELAPRIGFYDPGSPLAPLQFSDTKHRVVTFRGRAVSRFAELFPRELATRPGGLSIEGATVQVTLPSTARPAAPVVLDVVPTSSSVHRPYQPILQRRQGGWLRIYVARPWFVTGEGEQLGVVVPSQPPLGPSDPHYDVSSLLGADTAHPVTPFPTGLQTAHFEGATAGLTNVHIPESLGDRPASEVPDATILAYDPKFDPATQRWYFDIRINVPGSYFPLVRLAVVRYQRASIDVDPIDVPTVTYHHFSPVVLLEPVPLLPDRELKVDEAELPDGRGFIYVGLAGTTYDQLYNFTDPEGFVDDSPQALARVTAHIQQHRGLPLTGNPDDDWVTIASQPMTRDPDVDFPRWRTTFTCDLATTLPPGSHRLLVVEEDRLPSDPAGGTASGYTDRVVYADSVPLTHPILGTT